MLARDRLSFQSNPGHLFSNKRQVLVLTCHQRSLEAYKDIGATAITV